MTLLAMTPFYGAPRDIGNPEDSINYISHQGAAFLAAHRAKQFISYLFNASVDTLTKGINTLLPLHKNNYDKELVKALVKDLFFTPNNLSYHDYIEIARYLEDPARMVFETSTASAAVIKASAEEMRNRMKDIIKIYGLEENSLSRVLSETIRSHVGNVAKVLNLPYEKIKIAENNNVLQYLFASLQTGAQIDAAKAFEASNNAIQSKIGIVLTRTAEVVNKITQQENSIDQAHSVIETLTSDVLYKSLRSQQNWHYICKAASWAGLATLGYALYLPAKALCKKIGNVVYNNVTQEPNENLRLIDNELSAVIKEQKQLAEKYNHLRDENKKEETLEIKAELDALSSKRDTLSQKRSEADIPCMEYNMFIESAEEHPVVKAVSTALKVALYAGTTYLAYKGLSCFYKKNSTNSISKFFGCMYEYIRTPWKISGSENLLFFEDSIKSKHNEIAISKNALRDLKSEQLVLSVQAQNLFSSAAEINIYRNNYTEQKLQEELAKLTIKPFLNDITETLAEIVQTPHLGPDITALDVAGINRDIKLEPFANEAFAGLSAMFGG